MRTLVVLGLMLVVGCAAVKPAVFAGDPHMRIEGMQSPEDLIALPASSWVIVSNQRIDEPAGWLSAVDSRTPEKGPTRLFPTGPVTGAASAHCPGPPDVAVFSPHGINVHGDDLLVVNHGGREAIEIFRIGEGPSLTWRDCIILPSDLSANSVTALADGRIAITGMNDPNDPQIEAKAKSGAISGRVVAWDGNGWQSFTPQGFAFANGIAASKRYVFITEWTTRHLWRFDVDGTNGRVIDLDFLGDNIRWTPSGTLLVAGQRVSVAAFIACDNKQVECERAFAVVEVDPEKLTVQPRIVSDGTLAFGGASGAIVVGDELWVGNLLATAIGRYKADN